MKKQDGGGGLLEAYYGMSGFSVGLIAFGVELALLLLLTAIGLSHTAQDFLRPPAIYALASDLTECAGSILAVCVIFGLIADLILRYDRPRGEP